MKPRLDAAHHPLVIALLGLGVFLNVYATQALLPDLTREYDATRLAAASTVSATTLAMALMSPLVGALADTLGRKRIVIGALLALAVPCVMIANAATLAEIIAWRFVQGALIPGVGVVLAAYIAEELPPARVAPTLAAYISGTVVGGFGGRFITGLVAGITDWSAAFLVIAALNVVTALIGWAFLPAARAFHPQPAKATLPGIQDHLRNPALLAACGVGFGLLFALVAAFTYVNYHLAAEPYALSSAALGSVYAVYLLGVIVTPATGRVVTRAGPRVTLTAALAVSAFGFALTLAPALPVIVLGLAVGSCGVFIAQATATGYAQASITHGRSLASGLYNACYYAGGATGALTAGIAYERAGWTGAVLTVIAALGSAAALGWLAWRVPRS